MEKTTVKVFIASSAEVKEERDKCISFFSQINKSHPHLHLEAVEWEYDMVGGSNPGFETIQKAINPKLEECALCVFMFYSKIGKYTEEEFKLASELKKKIIPFFKKGFSPETDEAIAEWSKLVKFKKSMNETILYKEYQDVKDLELLLTQNLNLYLAKEFPLQSSYESEEIKKLKAELYDNQKEVAELKKGNLSIGDAETKKRLEFLEQQNNTLITQLSENKEIQQQQAKEKQELELRLSQQIANDNLKQQALIAIKENRYDDAKKFLKESAKDNMIEAASKIYELGKISKIQLLYKDALHYFELAAKMNPSDFQINMEAGRMLRESGYNDKAIVHFEKGLQLLEPGNSQDESNISYVYNSLGIAYNNKGEYNKAIGYYTQALVIDKKFLGEEHPNIAIRYNNIGESYRNKGEYDKAIEYFTKALVIDKKFHGEEHSSIAIRYNNIGLAYHNKGEHDKAIEYYDKTLVIDKKFYGEDHPDIAIDYNNIGGAYRSKGEYDKALEFYNKAHVLDKKFHGEEHPDIAIDCSNIGTAYLNKGEYDKAIEYCTQALAIGKKFHGEEHPDIAIRYNNIGTAYYYNGEYDKTIEYYQKALSIFIKFLGENHPSTVTVKKNLEEARESSAKSKK